MRIALAPVHAERGRAASSGRHQLGDSEAKKHYTAERHLLTFNNTVANKLRKFVRYITGRRNRTQLALLLFPHRQVG